MAYVGDFEFDTRVIAALAAEPDVTTLLGSSPMRVYTRVRRDTTLPFVRMTTIEAATLGGAMAGSSGTDWIRRHNRQFAAFSQQASCEEVSDVLKALIKVLDKGPDNIFFGSPASWRVLLAIPRYQICRYNAADATWMGVTEYEFSVS